MSPNKESPNKILIQEQCKKSSMNYSKYLQKYLLNNNHISKHNCQNSISTSTNEKQSLNFTSRRINNSCLKSNRSKLNTDTISKSRNITINISDHKQSDKLRSSIITKCQTLHEGSESKKKEQFRNRLALLENDNNILKTLFIQLDNENSSYSPTNKECGENGIKLWKNSNSQLESRMRRAQKVSRSLHNKLIFNKQEVFKYTYILKVAFSHIRVPLIKIADVLIQHRL